MKKENRRTKSQMYPLVKSWLESGQSRKIFCEAQQINIHTFNYWLHKYEEEEQTANEPAFVRLDQPVPSNSASLFIIRYPHGVQLQINTLLPPDELSKLIYLARP